MPALHSFARQYLRPLVDPSTALIILGIIEFALYYPHRTLAFIAAGIGLAGIGALIYGRWELTIPIQTFLLGTWIYNAIENNPDKNLQLVEIMLFFLLLLGYAFWKLFRQPTFRQLTTLQGLYVSLATLIVWELAVAIDLFWPVEPWSRAALVVTALVFLEIASGLRLSGEQNPRLLLGPLAVIILIGIAIIATTPIAQI